MISFPRIKLAAAVAICCLLVQQSDASILVVGSLNADTFLPVSRLPQEGENLTVPKGKSPIIDVPGGKGCTQAVAASKLSKQKVAFLGQFGNDSAATVLRNALEDASIDVSRCTTHADIPSGRGYVFLAESGSVSAVVSGGSNADGWSSWELHQRNTLIGDAAPAALETTTTVDADVDGDDDDDKSKAISRDEIDEMLEGVSCVMLQREVPEYVNYIIARAAKQKGGIIVVQDVGGEDRSISSDMLRCCDYIIPNETELLRLTSSDDAGIGNIQDSMNDLDNLDGEGEDALILKKARQLQQLGARNVLVTRGSRGSMLLTEDGQVLHQPAYKLSEGRVVDETGAGDCYRSAFAVSLLEGLPLQRCMQFASAAGSCAVEHQGAVPSTPTRSTVEKRFEEKLHPDTADAHSATTASLHIRGGAPKQDDEFLFLIGSRLNSMKDRPELYSDALETPADFVKRQATIDGLTCVDFNYPQHFHSWTASEARTALDDAGLRAGAVCLRYPSRFARGAMNHPDESLRKEAIRLTMEAAEVAAELGCDEVVVWSAYDGYDYMFQVNYDQKWDQLVDAFRQCCDAFPDIKFSLEYKPTDENTRFFTVPTTGAAMQLVDDIDRPNMGLTLDVGHMLMAGENPGQSIAMVGRKRKLFGIQLNDGFTRLAAEDGLMFGSVHPGQALEIMYQLHRTQFAGHFYFDTFPQRSDPVKEAEYNIRQAKRFWHAATKIDAERLQQLQQEHDAIAALELINESLFNGGD